MSVTFWIPDAPRTRLKTACTSKVHDTGEPCKTGKSCGYCQDGIEESWESSAPELNVANETAIVLLGILEIPCGPTDLYGSLEPTQIPTVRRNIVRALSTKIPERKAICGSVSKNYIYIGVEPERIRDRLSRLHAVLAYAQQNSQRVSWG